MPFWQKISMRLCKFLLLHLESLSHLYLKSYNEIVKDYKVTYVAGGASQNAARGAAVSLILIGAILALRSS